MRVVFYNHYHNGDIHVSRGIVRKVMERVREIAPETTFTYSHNNSGELLKDIDGLGYDRDARACVRDSDTVKRIGDDIYINTWYGQGGQKYLNRYGITFDSLYSAFDDNCKELWGFSLGEVKIEELFPKIDYTKFEISNIDKWLDSNKGKKVLVENGEALSNQSHKFDMTYIIGTLAARHKDKTFILTSRDDRRIPNVVYSSDIIGKSGNDLNEISYLSTHCDIVIGKASGVFSFTLTQENLFRRNVKYICFTNLPQRKYWLGGLLESRVNYSSTFIISNERNISRISSIIESNI